MSKKAYDDLMEYVEGKLILKCTTRSKGNYYASSANSYSLYPDYFFSFFMTVRKLLKEEFNNGKFPILMELSKRHVKSDDLLKLEEEINYVSEKFEQVAVDKYFYCKDFVLKILEREGKRYSTKGYLVDNWEKNNINDKSKIIDNLILEEGSKTLYELFKNLIATIKKLIFWGKGIETVDEEGNIFLDRKGDIWIWDSMIFDEKDIGHLPNFPLTWKEAMLDIIYNNNIKKKDVYKIVGEEELWEEMQKKWIEGDLKKAKKNYFEGGNKNFAKRILKNLSENKGIEEASRILKEIEELEKNEEIDS